MLPFLGNPSSPAFWAAWAFALVWQNYSFTRVSRARNSASLKAHALASVQSNSAWFLQSLFVYSAFMNILTGHAGILKAIGAGLFYTAFTMSGSIYAHYVSLKKEKGKSAVGASKLYAQIPVAEYEQLKGILATYEKTKAIAEEAHCCAVGALPVTSIAAAKIGGEVVISGLPK